MPNISQLKRKRILDFLNTIKEEYKSNDKAMMEFSEIYNEFNLKKYGLVWEEHEESIDVLMRNNIPVFTEVPDCEISVTPDDGYNFILEGDNLHSLRLLEKTHKGKIDVIYIDPPYNRGKKDFVYNDVYVDSTDGFRHSKWLSFMSKRLIIARALLSEQGSLFISVDDHEQAPLKMLCDEIFGEDHYITSIPRIAKKQRSAQEKHMDISHDYVICYSFSDDFSHIVMVCPQSLYHLVS